MTKDDYPILFEAYPIGTKIWFNGDEATIVSGPFMLHEAEVQTAMIGDRTITIISKGQKEKNEKDHKAAWDALQAQFRRLHE